MNITKDELIKIGEEVNNNIALEVALEWEEHWEAIYNQDTEDRFKNWLNVKFLDNLIKSKVDWYNKNVRSLYKLSRIYSLLFNRDGLKWTEETYFQLLNSPLRLAEGLAYSELSFYTERGVFGNELLNVSVKISLGLIYILDLIDEIVNQSGSLLDYVNQFTDILVTETMKLNKVMKITRLSNEAQINSFAQQINNPNFICKFLEKENTLVFYPKTLETTLNFELSETFFKTENQESLEQFKKDLKSLYNKYSKFISKYSELFVSRQ